MEIYIRSLKGQYGTNRIVPAAIFFDKLFHINKYKSFRWKFIKILDMAQTAMFQIQFFNKSLNTKRYMRLGGEFYKILERTIWVKPYCP